MSMSLSWLEKAMANHSSTLAWKIPWMKELGHNLNDLAVAAAALSWWWYSTINLQAVKCPSSQGYAFSIGHVSTGIHVSSGCESWTVKKAEHWRIDAFELWCWRRLLRVPWTARRSNQSILKEISPGCSLERLMLKLKFQYFGHLMRRVDSLEKTLMLGGIGGRRRRGR